MRFSNFHTHSVFSDGINTMEEMVLAAIEKNFSAIGFSDHSTMTFNHSYCMKPDALHDYMRTIRELKDKYSEQIQVFAGLELDYCSVRPDADFDYIIGSVHCIPTPYGDHTSVDSSAPLQRAIVKKWFDGDMNWYAQVYYKTVMEMAKRFKPDIVGHFDVVCKFQELENPVYNGYALEAAAAVLEHCSLFEINTGAIARGYKSVAYPSPFLMRYLTDHGAKFILSSDCHNALYLDCWFAEALEYCRSFGVRSLVTLTGDGFTEYGI
ncbi:MAG: histidinol-phosphatase HisJ family protein [Ruminococcaceae bacterium]|nr:histidinol-phosphatase HisJ family protein [Oscillospiraceae bacterium]